ncbi:MAG: hypothetical protein GY816_04310 [Cytophagales bacterium]|nr:hypothetical protein [Cytophagales bacterium]
MPNETSNLTVGYSQVARPTLVSRDKIGKYLTQIDESHWYSNFGQLNQKLSQRLSTKFGVPIVLCSSGTTALIGAIYGSAGRATQERPICILPSYSFVGTITAVICCGYQPILFDISLDNWDMEIDQLRAISEFDRVGLIVPVAIYGRLVSLPKWNDFSRQFGIPIVIDSAASFDLLSIDYLDDLNQVTLAVSLHATKVFATGEGGLILTSSKKSEENIIRAINFGFYGSRLSSGPSVNGKMSEYHAAVGLANLDNLESYLGRLHEIQNVYLEQSYLHRLNTKILCGEVTSLAYCFYQLSVNDSIQDFFNILKANKIDFRLWYEFGIHKHPEYKNIKKYLLPNTKILANSMIGIPMHVDLLEIDIEWILKSLKLWEKTK